jgi:AraC-like DNA-binding protein
MTDAFCRDILVLGMPETQINLREIHSVGPGTREWLVGADSAPALRSHGIFLAGWSETAPGFEFVRPRTPRAQVMATLDGSGLVWCEGSWRELTTGSVYVTPEGVDSRYHHASGPWSVAWVTWATGLSALTGPCRIETGDPDPLAACVQSLMREASGPRDPDAMACWCKLVDVQARRLAAPANTVANTRLGPLWRLVEASPADPWDLDRLAKAAGLGPETLRRICHAECDASPMHHVARIRMRLATGLLATGRYTVATVASRVGYENPYAFSTAFRRQFGEPPSRWMPRP